MNFARRDTVGARTGGCEQGLSYENGIVGMTYLAIRAAFRQALKFAFLELLDNFAVHLNFKMNFEVDVFLFDYFNR